MSVCLVKAHHRLAEVECSSSAAAAVTAAASSTRTRSSAFSQREQARRGGGESESVGIFFTPSSLRNAAMRRSAAPTVGQCYAAAGNSQLIVPMATANEMGWKEICNIC